VPAIRETRGYVANILANWSTLEGREQALNARFAGIIGTTAAIHGSLSPSKRIALLEQGIPARQPLFDDLKEIFRDVFGDDARFVSYGTDPPASCPATSGIGATKAGCRRSS
jgi:hypothetical protein